MDDFDKLVVALVATGMILIIPVTAFILLCF